MTTDSSQFWTENFIQHWHQYATIRDNVPANKRDDMCFYLLCRSRLGIANSARQLRTPISELIPMAETVLTERYGDLGNPDA